jgi:DNA repair photolyase
VAVSLPIHGRGAAVSPVNRFETLVVEPDGDYLDADGVPSRQTQFLIDSTRSIIAYNDSPDIPFDAGVSPYRGCEHGCTYCFARPFHEYLGFSAGLDFETRILVKPDAAKLLRSELMSPRYEPQTIAMSGITDVYQPVERRLGLARQCLEVLAEFRNPVTMITKNHLVTRDIDVFSRLIEFNAVRVDISITSLDNEISSKMEPRASSPAKRLAAVEACAKAGIPTGVMLSPIIPGLTDHEVPAILKAARDAGAGHASAIAVRLPGNVQPIFVDWLRREFPDRAQRIINRIREMRGGKLNNGEFFKRYQPDGEFAAQIRAMFDLHHRKLGFTKGPKLDASHFRRPGSQMSLF